MSMQNNISLTLPVNQVSPVMFIELVASYELRVAS